MKLDDNDVRKRVPRRRPLLLPIEGSPEAVLETFWRSLNHENHYLQRAEDEHLL